MVAPWIDCPSLEIDHRLPPLRRFSDAPPEAIRRGRELLQSVMTDVPEMARLAIPLVQQRTGDRFQKEIEGLARTFDVDWRDLLIANISYDLTIGSLGCSTIALATAEGPVVARNMDWWPEDLLARASCLIRVSQGNELLFANAGWPGSIGAVTGLSGNGFAVVLNAVMSPEGARTDGYPVMLYLRTVLEDASGFDEALQMLQNETLAASALITLVGSENDQRVVIERSPTQQALRWATDGQPLAATNDYRKLYRTTTHASSEIFETTCSRYDALLRFFANQSNDRPVSDEQLLYLLTDPNVLAGITAQHIIMRPAQQSIRLLAPRRFFGEN
ncbi:C45 family autoproteolytic acyltransferase/hydolase [Lignipirellula cremea]|uniref:Acyl-coenzyme A:6-aminopenicillanic acid acyl-transferase n=1 Tax=Lignipirellula cremea TaxID=2528010 RepID=A0A518E244_9BACT|nr:C45 family peptidase [Lignipirellula cremea]QDU98167.1 Acyl-coenzyme A:6-aminopenicillanic acid acyl-transferase [Lignipirellula cremea]